MGDDAVLARRQGLLTGERTAPGIDQEGYWFPRHQAAYAWVAGRFPSVPRVLDAGSGEGYGTRDLGRVCGYACGLELDALACRHAALTYPDCGFIRANLVQLPLRSSAFDLVVSMQVAEHIWDVPAYLKEIARVLVPGGIACISTPNRPGFSPGLQRGQRPTNPLHVEEFDAEQLTERMRGAGLVGVEIHGLGHGERITRWEAEHGPLVPALVGRISGSPGPPGMDAFVATLQDRDFRIEPLTDLPEVAVHDLIALGRAP